MVIFHIYGSLPLGIYIDIIYVYMYNHVTSFLVIYKEVYPSLSNM